MAFFARWLTWDAFKSILYGLGFTALCGTAIVLYHDIKGGATAEARLQCSQSIAAASAAEQNKVDAANAASESAAQIVRDAHRKDGGKATARALAIQKELQALAQKDSDPVCFPKSLAGALQ